MKILERVPSKIGRKYKSRGGWLFVSWSGKIYIFHIELGPVAFSIERRCSR